MILCSSEPLEITNPHTYFPNTWSARPGHSPLSVCCASCRTTPSKSSKVHPVKLEAPHHVARKPMESRVNPWIREENWWTCPFFVMDHHGKSFTNAVLRILSLQALDSQVFGAFWEIVNRSKLDAMILPVIICDWYICWGFFTDEIGWVVRYSSSLTKEMKCWAKHYVLAVKDLPLGPVV